jgi:hypothetical protein
MSRFFVRNYSDRFGIDLEPGILYEYIYNLPRGITLLAVLRIPDYEHDTRTQPPS